MSVKPKCPICSKKLKTKDEESQGEYWMHDPRNIHVDVLVSAHQDCIDKVKETYPTFDQPTQADYGDVRYHTKRNGTITRQTCKEFIESGVI
jgi:hypothetical protein